MPVSANASGAAALSICESLLLALNDHNILPQREIIGILRDAAAAHVYASPRSEGADLNDEAASLIQRIIDSGNSLRRR